MGNLEISSKRIMVPRGMDVDPLKGGLFDGITLCTYINEYGGSHPCDTIDETL